MRSHLHSTHLVSLCDEPQPLLSRPQCVRQLHHLSKSWEEVQTKNGWNPLTVPWVRRISYSGFASYIKKEEFIN